MVEDKKISHDDGRLPDEIKFAKFSGITWTLDSKGFFYQASIVRLNVTYFLLMYLQRFPAMEAKGVAVGEATGIQTESDQNAMLYYHRVGTSQCAPSLPMGCLPLLIPPNPFSGGCSGD